MSFFFYLKTAVMNLSKHFITNPQLQHGINEILKTEGVDFKDWRVLLCTATAH